MKKIEGFIEKTEFDNRGWINVYDAKSRLEGDSPALIIIAEDGEELPDVPEWIKCEDGLPRRFDTVLTFGELHITICQFADGIWRHWETNRENKHDVTHWMPLPKEPHQ